MTWQAWFTLAVTLGTLDLLARETFGPANVMLGAVILLLIVGIISPDEAFDGFGNSAPITVAALYILARAVEKTGLMQPVLHALLGRRAGGTGSLARLTISSAGASAFLNNTPLIAMLIPPITDWAEKTGQSPSRYLMPLSYAVILGGVVTIIGTSTNLVVSGLLDAKTGTPMGMFEITPIGLPVAVAGLAVMILTARRLLPERRPARRDVEQSLREFSMGTDNCIVESNTIIAAGAVVTQNTHVEAGCIYAGVPARKVKDISAEQVSGEIQRTADSYVKYAGWYKNGE